MGDANNKIGTSAELIGLSPNTIYYYQLVAANSVGAAGLLSCQRLSAWRKRFAPPNSGGKGAAARSVAPSNWRPKTPACVTESKTAREQLAAQTYEDGKCGVCSKVCSESCAPLVNALFYRS